MKKITYLTTVVLLALFVSCKNDKKSTDTDNLDASEMNTTSEENNSEISSENTTNNTNSTTKNTTESTTSNENNKNTNINNKSERTYIVSPDSTTINWTAYKTTDRIAVGGEFSKINFDIRNGSTIPEAFNNLEFSIPVYSIFTDNEGRDKILISSFFDVMLETKYITGKLSFDSEGMCFTTIKMNGISKKVPIDYFAAQDEINFTTELNLEDWDVTGALETLNKACGELHKGPDGVSKTWFDVAIHINVKY